MMKRTDWLGHEAKRAPIPDQAPALRSSTNGAPETAWTQAQKKEVDNACQEWRFWLCLTGRTTKTRGRKPVSKWSFRSCRMVLKSPQLDLSRACLTSSPASTFRAFATTLNLRVTAAGVNAGCQKGPIFEAGTQLISMLVTQLRVT